MSKQHSYTRALWSETLHTSSAFAPLSEDIETDVAIVGAGITGISAAYNLAGNGLKVVVLDSGETGNGTTGSSTGNLYVPNAKFHTILSKHGQEGLNAVAGMRASGMAFIEDRIKEFNIDCGFKRVPWYYFSTTKPGSAEISKEYGAVHAAGLMTNNTPPQDFPFEPVSFMLVEGQAQFNPLQYVTKLAASISGDNCRIFENTRVTNIKDGNPCIVETTGGTVRAKKVIQATHTPKGVYVVHTMMEVFREFAMAVRLNGDLPYDGIYWIRVGKTKYSIRTYINGAFKYLIVLYEPGKTGHREHTERSYKKLEKYLSSVFDVQEISYLWAAQNYSPADYMPYIGNSPMQNNVYIATGFSADGLVYGTAASMIISDLITGRENPWAQVFSPRRFTPLASAKKAIRENFDVTTHFIKDYIFRGTEKELSEIENGEGKIIVFRGDKVAVHRDENGKVRIVSPVCPHFGCMVHWNNGEKSWDCPCHGSRFSADGEVLEGPAFNGLKRLKD